MNAIERLQNDFNTWYEASSLSQFVRWWKTELKSLVPQKHHKKLFPQSIQVLLTQTKDEVSVWYNKNGKFEPYVNDENENQESWWHNVQHIINQADGKKVNVNYLLPNDEALIRKIALPQAAKENLDEVIGFELDKYVPFSADQVQLSYKIDKNNEDENKLLLDLAVIPKQKLTHVLNICDEKSIALDGIDINLDANGLTPSFLGVNLLPKEQRKIKDNFNLKLNAALVVVLIALIYFVMHTSVENKKQKITTLTDINAELQKQSRLSKTLKKELKTVIVSSRFLQNMKNDHPKIIAILSDITNILPDTTYLSKVTINSNDLKIEGLSNNANVLVPKLDKSSNWFVPQMDGITKPDSRTNKESFKIKADIKAPIEEDDNGQS